MDYLKIVIYMPEIDKEHMGGTIKTGLRATFFQEGTEWSQLRKLYGNPTSVSERHRHRYEDQP